MRGLYAIAELLVIFFTVEANYTNRKHRAASLPVTLLLRPIHVQWSLIRHFWHLVVALH